METPETAKGEPKVGIQGYAETTEVVEGRGPAKGNRVEHNTGWTQCRGLLQRALDWIRQAARRVQPCTTSVRYYLRQQPGAVIPHAGICAGGAG